MGGNTAFPTKSGYLPEWPPGREPAIQERELKDTGLIGINFM